MRHARRGFTLIEVLVTIGIIMLLVAILAYSYRAINRTAATKETHAELKVCKGMLAEYEGRNGLQAIEFYMAGGVQQKDTGAPPNTPQVFPVYADPAATMGGANLTNTANASPAPAGSCWPVVYAPDVTSTSNTTDMGDRSPGSARYQNAVQRTLDISYVLMRIPANQTIAQTLQTKRVMEPIIPNSGGNVTPNPISQGVVLLDGWSNPIIFVPRGGLHVNIKDPSSGTLMPYVVRSTGTFPVPSGGNDPPMTGNERPFFASAGQDGDFTQGEDNVYSFQE